MKFHKTILILVVIIFTATTLSWPVPELYLRPKATLERLGIVLNASKEAMPGIITAQEGVFNRSGRFAHIRAVTIHDPRMIGIWIHPDAPGYDHDEYAVPPEVARTGKKPKEIGVTVKQFVEKPPADVPRRLIFAGSADQFQYQCYNTLFVVNNRIVTKTAPGVHQTRAEFERLKGLDGVFSVFVLDAGKVAVREIEFKDGQVVRGEVKDINLGIGGPCMIANGISVVDSIEYAGDKISPRKSNQVTWPPETRLASFSGIGLKKGEIVYVTASDLTLKSQPGKGIYIADFAQIGQVLGLEWFMLLGGSMDAQQFVAGVEGVQGLELPSLIESSGGIGSRTADYYAERGGRPLKTILYTSIEPPRFDLVRAANRAYYQYLGEEDTLDFRTEENITEYNAKATAIEVYRHLKELKAHGRLPSKIVLQEWGIGNSTFMQDFMIAFLEADADREFMDIFEYQGYDISLALLHHAQDVLKNCETNKRYPSYKPLAQFRDRAKFTQIDLMEKLPVSDVKPLWIRFEELYDDFGEMYFVERKDDQWLLVEFSPVMKKPCVIKRTDGTTIDFQTFLRDYFFAPDPERLQQIANLREIIRLIEYEERLVPLPAELQSDEYVGAYLAHIELRVKDCVRMPLNVGAAKNLCAAVDLLDKECGVLQFFDYGFYEDYPLTGDKFASYEKGSGGWLTAALNFDFLEFVFKRTHPKVVFQISGQMAYQTNILGKLSHPDLEVNYEDLYQVKITLASQSQGVAPPLSATRGNYRPEETLAECI